MYTIKRDDTLFVFETNGQPLLTPMMNRVTTQFPSLAKKLLSDLNEYGEDPSNPLSLVAFHYAMLDFFSNNAPRAELEHSVAIGLSEQNDWTFNCPTAAPEMLMDWMGIFGIGSSNAESGKEWLSSLSLMQLCAVTIIGRALESVNIPFIVATRMSPKDVKRYAKAVNAYYPYVTAKDLVKYFENFMFYYSLESKSGNKDKKILKKRG